MARNQAACNKAIRKAWQRERELVLAGKGSRNWTPEQREQLITKGKVYDDDGKAFIGQHMKSVSGYDAYQGDADNIQLLSLEEHFEAHKRNWQTVTNWYYDPDTKKFYDFDVYDYSKFPPDDYCNFHPEECRVSFEVISEESPKEKTKESTTSEKKKEGTQKTPKSSPEKTKPEPPKLKIEPQKNPGLFSKMFGGAKKIWTDTVWPHLKEHPLETLIGVATTVGGVISAVSHSTGNRGSGENASAIDVIHSNDKSESNSPEIGKSDSGSAQDEEKNEADDISDTPDRPYTPNDVPAGRQRYHYKDGTIRERDRRKYSRGKKKTDDS